MKRYWDRLWQSSLVRFGLVGVLNTVVGTTIMFVLYNKLLPQQILHLPQ